MTEIQRIENQLRRAFRGDAWHGDSLRELLAGVTAEQAAAKPLVNAHSIWEIVLHIGAWMEAVQRRIETSKPVELSDEEDWPPVINTSERSWKRALDELDMNYGQLLGTLPRVNEPQLQRTVAGRDYSIYFMLHGVIQHSLYHAGQIAILKKS